MAVAAMPHGGVESIAQFSRHVLQIMSQKGRSSLDVVIVESDANLRPDISFFPLARPMIDTPASELHTPFNKPLCPHMTHPDVVVRRQNELGFRELLF